MYCAKCGTENSDSCTFCAACGRSLGVKTAQAAEVLPPAGFADPRAQYQPQQSPQYPTPYQPMYVQQPSPYQPVYVQRPAVPYPHVSSHMGFAIVSLVMGVFTFWLLGSSIPAMVYASKVDRMVAYGDVLGAQGASRTALTWCWVTLGLFLLGVVAVVVAILVAAASADSYYY